MQLSDADLASGGVLTQMKNARARRARIELRWAEIEPSNTLPPTYQWASIDAEVAALGTRDIAPFGLVYTRPVWAASDDCGPVDLVPLERYQAFITALVERYDGDGVDDVPGSWRIGYWEIENEPDFDPSMAGGQPHRGSCFGGSRAADYGLLLRAAYLAIKAADPRATVVFGGLAYDRFHNKAGYAPVGPHDYAFASNVLGSLHQAHGGEPGWPFFDWMGVHVFNELRNNWDGAQPYNQELSAKLAELRQNQLYQSGVYDLRGRPLAVTELGLASAPEDLDFERSESLQSIYPGRELARAMAAGVPALLWQSGKDHRSGACAQPLEWLTFGLLRSLSIYQQAQACSPNPLPSYSVSSDNETKPAWLAFRTAQEQLEGLVFDTAFGTADTGDRRIEAYRFAAPGSGTSTIVAFTDSGEAIGRRGFPPVLRFMSFKSSMFTGWTGRLLVTDHLGGTTVYIGFGSIILQVDQEPIYVEPF
ncbi:MAG: hypothetical protein KDH92_01995 [Chloroflexi bacterium]|nr:hypothetical protein [Chloroflexota bacterium]